GELDARHHPVDVALAAGRHVVAAPDPLQERDHRVVVFADVRLAHTTARTAASAASTSRSSLTRLGARRAFEILYGEVEPSTLRACSACTVWLAVWPSTSKQVM